GDPELTSLRARSGRLSVRFDVKSTAPFILSAPSNLPAWLNSNNIRLRLVTFDSAFAFMTSGICEKPLSPFGAPTAIVTGKAGATNNPEATGAAVPTTACAGGLGRLAHGAA